MINWYAVMLAAILGAVFGLLMPLWAAIPAAACLGILLGRFLPVAGRHRREQR